MSSRVISSYTESLLNICRLWAAELLLVPMSNPDEWKEVKVMDGQLGGECTYSRN